MRGYREDQLTEDQIQYRRDIINKAKGLRTQKKFAEDCGLTAPYMSKILTGTIRLSLPSLEKIAAHAEGGLTLKDLKDAYGYGIKDTSKTAQRAKVRFRVLTAADCGHMVEIAAAYAKGLPSPTPESYIEAVTKILYKIGKEEFREKDIDGELTGNTRTDSGRVYQEADFMIRTRRDITRVKAVASWIPDASSDSIEEPMLLTRSADLKKYFPDAVEKEVHDDTMPYTEREILLPNGDKSPEELLLDQIFGRVNGSLVDVPTLSDGYGCYVDEVSEEKIEDACRQNKEYWPEGLTDPKKFSDERRDQKGLFGLYAYILTIRTGFTFLYVNPEDIEGHDKFVQKKALIYVPDTYVESGSYDKSAVLKACERAARELGVKRYGTVWYQWVEDRRTEPEYQLLTPLKGRSLQLAPEVQT